MSADGQGEEGCVRDMKEPVDLAVLGRVVCAELASDAAIIEEWEMHRLGASLGAATEGVFRVSGSAQVRGSLDIIMPHRVVLVLPEASCAMVVLLSFAAAYKMPHCGGSHTVHSSSAGYDCGMYRRRHPCMAPRCRREIARYHTVLALRSNRAPLRPRGGELMASPPRHPAPA